MNHSTMKPKTLARQTAELIAAELFTPYGSGERKAVRLKMEFDEDERSCIGWAEYAVAGRIEDILSRRHLKKGVVVK